MTTNKYQSMTNEELIARLERVEAEKAAKVSIKISRKGGISVYGLGRFPVTLYRSQWEALFNADVQGFLAENEAEITTAEERWNGLTPEQQAREDAQNGPKTKPVSGKAALVDSLTG